MINPEIRRSVRAGISSRLKYTYEFLPRQTVNPLSFKRTFSEIRWYRGL